MSGGGHLGSDWSTSQYQWSTTAIDDERQQLIHSQMPDVTGYVGSINAPRLDMPTLTDSQASIYSALAIPMSATAALPSPQPSFSQMQSHTQLYWPPPAIIPPFSNSLVFTPSTGSATSDAVSQHIDAGAPLWPIGGGSPFRIFSQSSQSDLSFTQMSPYDQHQPASQTTQPYYSQDPAAYATGHLQATAPFAVGADNNNVQMFARAPNTQTPRPGVKHCSICHATDTPTWRRHKLTQKCVCNACGLYYQLHERDRKWVQNARGEYVVKRQPRGSGKRAKSRVYTNKPSSLQ